MGTKRRRTRREATSRKLRNEEVVMSKSSDTLLAFFIGAVAGGITALLLAPDKGSETRRKLRQGASELYAKGEKVLDEAGHAVGEKVHDLSSAARGKAGELVGAARHQVDAVKAAVSEGRDAYRRELHREG
jgi:gas vesicle protein